MNIGLLTLLIVIILIGILITACEKENEKVYESVGTGTRFNDDASFRWLDNRFGKR